MIFTIYKCLYRLFFPVQECFVIYLIKAFLFSVLNLYTLKYQTFFYYMSWDYFGYLKTALQFIYILYIITAGQNILLHLKIRIIKV